jgi:hypothetical protein
MALAAPRRSMESGSIGRDDCVVLYVLCDRRSDEAALAHGCGRVIYQMAVPANPPRG